MLDTLCFQPSLYLTDGVRSLHARLTAQTCAWLCVVLRPIPRCARDQRCALSSALLAGRSSLQGGHPGASSGEPRVSGDRTAEGMPATARGVLASRFGVASPNGPLLRPARSPLRRRRLWACGPSLATLGTSTACRPAPCGLVAPATRLDRPSVVFNCGFLGSMEINMGPCRSELPPQEVPPQTRARPKRPPPALLRSDTIRLASVSRNQGRCWPPTLLTAV